MKCQQLEISPLQKVSFPAEIEPQNYIPNRLASANIYFLPTEPELVTRLFYLATFDNEDDRVPFTEEQAKIFQSGWSKARVFAINPIAQRKYLFRISATVVGLLGAIMAVQEIVAARTTSALAWVGYTLIGVSLLANGACLYGNVDRAYNRALHQLIKSYQMLAVHLVRLKDQQPRLAQFLAKHIKIKRIETKFQEIHIDKEIRAFLCDELRAAKRFVRRGGLQTQCSDALSAYITEAFYAAF